MDTFDDLTRFEVSFWYTADAGRALVVHILRLNASHAAKLLIWQDTGREPSASRFYQPGRDMGWEH